MRKVDVLARAALHGIVVREREWAGLAWLLQRIFDWEEESGTPVCRIFILKGESPTGPYFACSVSHAKIFGLNPEAAQRYNTIQLTEHLRAQQVENLCSCCEAVLITDGEKAGCIFCRLE